MQKLRPSPSTYTIHAPLSVRRSHQSNYQEQSSTSASTELYSPRSKIIQPVFPQKTIQEYGQEPSDLNTSGNNSTIYECVKMLEANDHSLSQENNSRSPTSDETKMDPTKKFSAKDLRIVCQEDYGQVLALKDPRSRKNNPNVSETVREFAELMKTKDPHKDEKEKVLRVSQETTGFHTNTRSSQDKDTKDTIPLLKYQIISPKNSTKNSILKSHTPLFNGSKPPSTTSSLHQSTRRRLRDSSTFKESQSATQRSRIGTSPPLTDRENRENISNQCQPNIHHQSAKVLYSQVTSPQSQKYRYPSTRTSEATPTQNKIVPRRDSCPQKQLLQNPVPPLNLNLNQNIKPTTITLSRSVQALATPRGEYSLQNNNENLKTVESARSPNTKSTKKLEHNKIKKEMQEPRAARIDLVGTDLMTKCLQKKDSKMTEKVDQIDKMYTKLRKSLMDKKDDLANNDKVFKMLETLKNDMQMIYSSINNNDWKSK